MSNEAVTEARRQMEICNACRYCEGLCSVFPAISRQRSFVDSDIIQLANLCHNCRGCYYACQYTEPHEFALNLPKALAEVQQDSWQEFAVPQVLASTFRRHGAAIGVAMLACIALFILIVQTPSAADGAGFYAVLSHNAMASIFTAGFLLPVVLVAVSVRKYWRAIGGEALTFAHCRAATKSIISMKNLSGGHGDGCNFEDEDRFSNIRRWLHQAVMYGFLLCFAATSVATVMHYAFNLPAPYPLFSLPKLFGLTGGVLLSVGCLGLAGLKLKADRALADARAWGGEMGFILLLFLVSTTGLALYGFAESNWLAELLAIHLGSVLAFFLITPYSKMMHGFYRLAALLRDAQS